MKSSSMKPKKISTHKKLLFAAYPIIIAVCALAVVFAAVSGSRCIEYLVTDGNTMIKVSSYSQDPEEVLREVGIFDTILSYNVEDKDNYTEIQVEMPVTVSVECDGSQIFTSSGKSTVKELLDNLGIVLSEEDQISCDMEDVLYDGMEINVTRVKTEHKTVTKQLPNQTKYIESPYLDYGEETVISEGSDGKIETIYKGVYINGILESLSIESQSTTEPVDEIIAYGTKGTEPDAAQEQIQQANKGTNVSTEENNHNLEDGQDSQDDVSTTETDTPSSDNIVTTLYGEELEYSKVLNMTATAYTYHSGANITSSGAPAQVGIVAALPSTIPQGTTVYIVAADGSWEYGVAIVGDRPAHDIIDLFMETRDECIQFGVRDALVYILD